MSGTSQPDDTVSGERPPTSPETGSPRTWLPWATLGVGLLVLAVGLFAWWRADGDDEVALAEQRDEVVIAARHHIETMNTLDHRKVDEGLAAWESVSTGKLKDSLADLSDEQKKMLADQQKVSVGKVLDAAVVEMESDSAVVIAAIEVTVQDAAKPETEPSVKRNRFSATLTRAGEKWLIEDLQQVAVNLS